MPFVLAPVGIDLGLLLLPLVRKTFKHNVFTNMINIPLTPPIDSE